MNSRLPSPAEPPLIAHVLFSLVIGGLENGVVNLINQMPRHAYRHAIVCVRGKSEFQRRLQREDVPLIALEQKSGIEPSSYLRAWRTFRELRPAIVHTRNLAALEMQLPAALAGNSWRVHSEHGRDGLDLNGDYLPYNLLRKSFRPLVHRYLAMSRNLQNWLVDTIGAQPNRVSQIYNGVDTHQFAPSNDAKPDIGPAGFFAGAKLVVGTVGRMVPIKDHATLLLGFAELARAVGAHARDLRLVVVGDGPERRRCETIAREHGIDRLCWVTGERHDVADLLHLFDVFCLTSLNEGISNTILEAMASGLPVVATSVGGNPELVADGSTGRLVPRQSPQALAAALLEYFQSKELAKQHGDAGRLRAEREFSLDAMVAGYLKMYDTLIARRLPMQRVSAA